MQIQPKTTAPPLIVDIPNNMDKTTKEAIKVGQGIEVTLEEEEEAPHMKEMMEGLEVMAVMEVMVGMVVILLMEVIQVDTSTKIPRTKS